MASDDDTARRRPIYLPACEPLLYPDASLCDLLLFHDGRRVASKPVDPANGDAAAFLPSAGARVLRRRMRSGRRGGAKPVIRDTGLGGFIDRAARAKPGLGVVKTGRTAQSAAVDGDGGKRSSREMKRASACVWPVRAAAATMEMCN